MSRFQVDSSNELPNPASIEDFNAWAESLKPTADVVDSGTLEVSSDKIRCKTVVPRWVTVELDYEDFSKAALTSDDVEVIQLPAGGIIHMVLVDVPTAFTKAAEAAFTSTLVLNVGTTAGTPTELISGADLKTATTTAPAEEYYLASGSANGLLTRNAPTTVICNAVSGATDNLDKAEAGAVKIHLYYSVVS